MALVKLDCPSCSASLDVDESRSLFFCSYCGTKVVQEKKVVELVGTVKVDGLAGEGALIERAFGFLEMGNFARADEYLERALDINPHSARAYMGKLMCKLRERTFKSITTRPNPISGYEFYKKALLYSKGKEHDEYVVINDIILSRQKK